MNPIILLQAFAAGVIAFFSPCTVAMLPAYVGYFVGRDEERSAPVGSRPVAAALAAPGALLLLYGLLDIFAINRGASGLSPLQIVAVVGGTLLFFLGLRRLAGSAVARGACVGLVTSAGIVAVFLLLGVQVALISGFLDIATLATMVLATGAILILVGAFTLAGKELPLAIPWRAPAGRDALSFFTFGVGYGVVSTGCNLPIFLLAVGGALVSGSFLDGLAAFLAYGLGAASLMVAVSVSVAAGRGLTRPGPLVAARVKRATGLVLLAAGLYIVFYYWTVLRAGAPPF